jgi:hypothetical protein
MRNWEGKRSRPSSRQRPTYHQSFSLSNPDLNNSSTTVTSSAVGAAHNDKECCYSVGPELLLTPVQEYLTNNNISNMRDDTSSPTRGRRSHNSSRISPIAVATQYSIPVDDILLVNTSRSSSNSTRLHMTTLSLGLFEFDCLSLNGHDILLAFLQASLQPERILEEECNTNDSFCSDNFKSGSSVTSCLDIDTLQAKHLKGRADAETWPEKLSRRVGHVFSNLSELSSSFCDAACCRDAAAEPRDAPAPSAAAVPEKTYRFAELEIDDAVSTVCSPKAVVNHHDHRHPKKTKQPHKLVSLPSGLSVEPDPEFEPR